MEKASRGRKGRLLIATSLKLLEQHKRLFLYPVFSYLVKFLIYAALITPFLHSYEHLLNQVNHLPAAQVGSVIVIFMLLLFLINNVLFFFNTAIIANLLHFFKYQREVSIRFGFHQAFKQYGRVYLWAFYAGTAGLILNLLPRSSHYHLKLQKLLRHNHWAVASFLSLSLILDKKSGPLTALRESSQFMNGLWGENLQANYSFFGLLTALRLPALLVFILSALWASSHITLIVVGLIAGLLILLASSFYQLINTTLRVVCYCYAQYGIVPPPFTENMIQKLFVKKI